MIRRAFTMRLKPGALAEYKHHHDNVWPELVREIERSGIATITTFVRDPDLFLFSEIHDPDAWNKLWASDIHREWGELMKQFMHFRDGIVDAGELTEIFRLETGAGGKTKAKAKPTTAKRRSPSARRSKRKASRK